MEEFSHTFRFFDTRKLYHDTPHSVFKTLDIRLNYTETVDTCTEYIIRVFYGSFYFRTQYFFYFSIR